MPHNIFLSDSTAVSFNLLRLAYFWFNIGKNWRNLVYFDIGGRTNDQNDCLKI